MRSSTSLVVSVGADTETPMEQSSDQERLGHLKAELTKQLWSESLDDLFHVTLSAHQLEKSV